MRRTALSCLTLAALIIAPAAASAKRPTQQPPPPEAGPAVSYTDVADDAYEPSLGVPNPLLSDASLDIVRVDFAPVPHAKNRTGGYTTSITLKGGHRTEVSYVSAGRFQNGLEYCELYHFLTTRATRTYANAFCDSDPDVTSRFVGRIWGGAVTATTTGGATTLSAQFDNTSIPAQLAAANRTLTSLFAFTCVDPGDDWGCGSVPVVDMATTTTSYRI